jgi:hypothetical protein
LHHGVGVVHLHADHLDLRTHRLDVVGHARDQPAAADGHEDRVEPALVLAQDFHGNGALARNHVGIVERVNEGQALLGLQLERVQIRVGIAVAVQHDFATEAAHRIDLEPRCRHRHDHHRACAQLARAQCHALRVIAGRSADDAHSRAARA